MPRHFSHLSQKLVGYRLDLVFSNIYLFLATSSTCIQNFKSVALASSSINSAQTNNQTNHWVLILYKSSYTRIEKSCCNPHYVYQMLKVRKWNNHYWFVLGFPKLNRIGKECVCCRLNAFSGQIEFSLVIDSKRRCKGMYLSIVVSEKLYWNSEYYTY